MARERPSDGDLIGRMQRGDTAAFAELFERHQRGLFAYVMTMTRNPTKAEDVVQASFLALAANAAGLDPSRGVRAWLYRVARNRTIDDLRRESREPSLEPAAAQRLVDGPRGGGNPLRVLLGREDAARLNAALGRLPESKREAVVLRFFGDLRFREIAAVTGRPLGTVLWQVRSALGDLRDLLRDGVNPDDNGDDR